MGKHQRRLSGFDEQVISLYAKGMTTGDIAAHLAEIYGTDISRDTVSTVTARVAEDLKAWQSRPLDRVYPVIIIDAIMLKVREITKQLRGIYTSPSLEVAVDRFAGFEEAWSVKCRASQDSWQGR